MRAVKGKKMDGEEGGILTSTQGFFQSPAPNLPAWVLLSVLVLHGPFSFVVILKNVVGCFVL